MDLNKNHIIKTYKANGKLLLSGEYFVLDGAMALALPTRFGQSLSVQKIEEKKIIWKSLDQKKNTWFQGEFIDGIYQKGSDTSVGRTLEKMFLHIFSKNKNLNKNNFLFKTELDFPRNWGLGSSSTLIYNLAQWANINPYQLLENTMGGSGYDIACASATHPIIYQKQNGIPFSKKATFNPTFKEHLFFIFLEKKQNSRTGIQYYKNNVIEKESIINRISIITQRFMNATTISEFNHLIQHHENLISSSLQLPKIKENLFSDYWGEIKSLGAWGGDFILATSKKSYEETKFFRKRLSYIF